MKVWIVVLALAIGALGYLALAPADDGSYDCDGVPIALLVDPMPERSNEFFFDEGTQCNADAARRGRTMAVVAALGAAAVVGLFIVDRRNRRPPTIES